MKKITISLYIIILPITLIISCSLYGQVTTLEENTFIGPDVLKTNMRKLCEDHVTYTRNIIFCIVDELPGKEEATQRLIKNLVDITNAIEPYYGSDVRKQLTVLLKTHVELMIEVINQAKVRNEEKLEMINKKWYANASEISVLLRKMNPNWALTDIKLMMYNHLTLTSEEAMNRINKNYPADAATFEEVQIEIKELSDKLVEDIVVQFPNKFSPTLALH